MITQQCRVMVNPINMGNVARAFTAFKELFDISTKLEYKFRMKIQNTHTQQKHNSMAIIKQLHSSAPNVCCLAFVPHLFPPWGVWHELAVCISGLWQMLALTRHGGINGHISQKHAKDYIKPQTFTGSNQSWFKIIKGKERKLKWKQIV